MNKTVEKLQARLRLLEGKLEKCERDVEFYRGKAHRLRSMLMEIPDAVLVVDSERIIVMANYAVERIFGYETHELVGKSTEVLYRSHQDYQEFGRIKANQTPEERSAPVPFRLKRKSGEVFPCEIVAIPVFREDGVFDRAIALIQDTSELEELHRFTNTIKEQLEHEVREGTQELKALTKTISHDLKNPVIALKGFASLLDRHLEEGGDEKAQGLAANIADSAEWIDDLLNDLIELNRSRDVSLNTGEVELGSLVAKVINGALGSASGRITFESFIDVPRVFADEHLLRRVLENLVANAIKFMPPGRQGVVTVGAQSSGADVMVWVSDNGDGIPPAKVQSIFYPFVRLEEDVPGMGLGLEIAKRLVKLHGGKIWAVSNDEIEGARINFTLPQNQVDQK